MMYFLMETILDKEGFQELYKDLPFQNRIITKQLDLRGGLAFLWKSEVNIKLINYLTNHVLISVKEDHGSSGILQAFMPDQK